MMTIQEFDGPLSMDVLRMDPCTASTVVEVLIGSKKVRYGPRPSLLDLNYLHETVNKCQAEGRPIEILSCWGASKGYNQFDLQLQSADLLDLMALKRLACLYSQVKTLYEPSIHFTIFMEDYSGKLLGRKDSPTYFNTFVNLCHGLAMQSYVTVTKESWHITDPNYARDVMLHTYAIRNGEAAKYGWVGEIPWTHYLIREAKANPNRSSREHYDNVSIYLGSTLTRYKHKIFPPYDLKLSFCPYPPTVPDAFRKGRLEYKLKANKNSHSTPSPWTCFGRIKDGDWTFASVSEMRENPYKLIPFHVNGLCVPAVEMELTSSE